MGYNPDEKKFEQLPANEADIPAEKRDWTRFQEGELISIKGVMFYVHEIGESRMVLKIKK